MKAAVLPRSGIWNRSHHLDRMTFRELVVASGEVGEEDLDRALDVAALTRGGLRPKS